jgi:ribosomal protein S27AE
MMLDETVGRSLEELQRLAKNAENDSEAEYWRDVIGRRVHFEHACEQNLKCPRCERALGLQEELDYNGELVCGWCGYLMPEREVYELAGRASLQAELTQRV